MNKKTDQIVICFWRKRLSCAKVEKRTKEILGTWLNRVAFFMFSFACKRITILFSSSWIAVNHDLTHNLNQTPQMTFFIHIFGCMQEVNLFPVLKSSMQILQVWLKLCNHYVSISFTLVDLVSRSVGLSISQSVRLPVVDLYKCHDVGLTWNAVINLSYEIQGTDKLFCYKVFFISKLMSLNRLISKQMFIANTESKKNSPWGLGIYTLLGELSLEACSF